MGVRDFLEYMKSQTGRTGRTELTAVHNSPAGQTNRAEITAAHNSLPVKREPMLPQELPADVRALAMEKLAFVRLVQARMKQVRSTAPDACLYVAVNHVQEFPLLCKGGKKGSSALHYNNYRNWTRRLMANPDPEHALQALCDNYTRGVRERKGDQIFWNLFFALYLNQNRLHITQAYSMACARIRKEYKEMVVPSLAQVRYQINLLPPDKLILAREGEEAWRNKCGDFIRRNWTDIAAGECVIGDSRTFDTRVRVWDEEKNCWMGVRPTIAGLMDGRSWFLASYWITAEPVNTNTLIDTLRLYLRSTDGVPPPIVYFDNGKDYCAAGFSTPFDAEGYQHSIFKELGIKLLNSLAYNARAKTIERAFRDMMQQFDKVFPDYLGSKPGQRTMAADYYDDHPEELPSLQQFCDLFAQWLHKWHNTPKGGSIHQGRSPQEIWNTRKNNGRRAFTPEELQFAFYKPEAIRTVGRGPAVKFDNELYYSDRLTWGKKLLIKSDSMDPTHILCYTLDGCFVCEAKTRKAIHALSASHEEIRELMAKQRKQLKEARTAIADLSGNMHIYSPLELLMTTGENLIGTKAGEVTKVKGTSHHYEHFTLPGVIEEAEEKEIMEANEKPDKPDLSDLADGADLSDIYNFIHKKQGENDDEF